MPADLLAATQAYDTEIGIEIQGSYVARVGTAKELALIKRYIEILPRSYLDIFEKKLLAVYLVDGFAGAGLTDWVLDHDGRSYYYLIFNSALLTTSLDDWFSLKENSAFEQTPLKPRIRVSTQTDYKALLYGMLHEGAHIVDDELGVTPYVDNVHRAVQGRTQTQTDFTESVWLTQKQAVAGFDFKHRGVLNVYGLFAKKGLIPRTEMPVMFAQLKRTPFVSFYSGTSWNEDWAEYSTYHVIEKKLGGKVLVELVNEQGMIDRYVPIESALALKREAAVREYLDCVPRGTVKDGF
jgi:hypothetical protein